jgi:Uma2 family endonuclease
MHFLICLWLLDFLRNAAGRKGRYYLMGDVFVYPESEHVERKVAPDIALFLGVSAEPRRVWKVWEEGRTPELVVEVVSDTEGGELGRKLQLYAQMGVKEYLVVDPAQLLLGAVLGLWRRGETGLVQVEEGVQVELKTVGILLCWAEEQLTARWPDGSPLPLAEASFAESEKLRTALWEEKKQLSAVRRAQKEEARLRTLAEAERQEEARLRAQAEAERQEEARRRALAEAERDLLLAELRRLRG